MGDLKAATPKVQHWIYKILPQPLVYKEFSPFTLHLHNLAPHRDSPPPPRPPKIKAQLHT